MRAEEQQQQQSSMFYELCYMIVHILKPIQNPYLLSRPSSSSRQPLTFFSQVSPAEFASHFLGISLALMLFGSVTFAIGFILMPWVIWLVFLFYLAGFVSKLSELAQSFFISEDLPAWNVS